MKKTKKGSMLVISIEILFTLLPVIIVLIVSAFSGTITTVIYRNDWSFVSIVLFGQSIIKIASGTTKTELKIRWQVISFVISLLIIFGIIPSTIILILLTTIKSPTLSLYITQLCIFVLSILVYFILGSIGQMFLDGEMVLDEKK